MQVNKTLMVQLEAVKELAMSGHPPGAFHNNNW